MNSTQKEAMDMALQGHNMLLLGSAGTGKLYIINNIYDQLSKTRSANNLFNRDCLPSTWWQSMHSSSISGPR